MCDRGFTLLETLFMCSIITFMYAFFIFKRPVTSTSLMPIVYQVKEVLLQEQLTAIRNKETRDIEISENRIETSDKSIFFPKGIWADSHAIKYFPNGNINQAKSVCFYNTKAKLCLVLQLGSGQIAIR